MAEHIRIVADPLAGWLPVETDEQLADRTFHLAKVAADEFKIDILEDEEFVRMYRRIEKVALDARVYHEHVVMIAAMMLRDLLDTELVHLTPELATEEQVDKAIQHLCRRIMWVIEHIGFSEKPFRSAEALNMLPKSVRTIPFNFTVEGVMLSQNETNPLDGMDEEELFSFFENLPDPDEYKDNDDD